MTQNWLSASITGETKTLFIFIATTFQLSHFVAELCTWIEANSITQYVSMSKGMLLLKEKKHLKKLKHLLHSSVHLL